MKKIIKILLSLIFVLLVIAMIVGFTMQVSHESAVTSERVRIWLNLYLGKLGVSDEALSMQWWNEYKMFRRSAYIIEYFALAVAVNLLVLSVKRTRLHLVITFVACAVLSVGDQCLKLLNPGREFDPIDLKFAFAGYAVAVVVMGIVCGIKRLVRKKK